MQSGDVDVLAIKSKQSPVCRLAQTDCLFEHGIEHRPEVSGRRINDLQHLGGRGLLLQRLARLGDQPRIFHCDHRLSGEVPEEGNLLVSEEP